MTNYENPFLELDDLIKAGKTISNDTDATVTTGDNPTPEGAVDSENQSEQDSTGEQGDS
ncbi:MAG: hypothetical protein NUV98_02800 [Candidatus Roizmanbacteria bacterium]|nr:hypothetical protein [Candidatus Roizmanbacteria bacterium]